MPVLQHTQPSGGVANRARLACHVLLAFSDAANPGLIGSGERIGSDRFFESLFVAARSEGRAYSVLGKGPATGRNNKVQYTKNTTHASHHGHTKIMQ